MRVKKANPWDSAMLVVAGALILAASLGILSLLLVVAFTGTAPEMARQQVQPRTTALVLLGTVGVLSYVLGMSARWDRKNR